MPLSPTAAPRGPSPADRARAATVSPHPALSPPIPLPDAELGAYWEKIILPPDLKQRALNHALLGLTLRGHAGLQASLPVHGLLLFEGKPGVGKTKFTYGLANKAAEMLNGKFGQVRFVELNPHALTSELLGRSQRAVVEILQEHIPALADDGPLVLLLDEVEALATARASMSMETNPVDVHRATDAVLTGIDRLAAETPRLLTLATTNFTQAVDAALISRADHVFRFPMPSEQALIEILEDTVAALRVITGADEPRITRRDLEHAARLLEGVDGRRARKLVLDALASDPELTLNPAKLKGAHLVEAAKRLKGAD